MASQANGELADDQTDGATNGQSRGALCAHKAPRQEGREALRENPRLQGQAGRASLRTPQTDRPQARAEHVGGGEQDPRHEPASLRATADRQAKRQGLRRGVRPSSRPLYRTIQHRLSIPRPWPWPSWGRGLNRRSERRAVCGRLAQRAPWQAMPCGRCAARCKPGRGRGAFWQGWRRARRSHRPNPWPWHPMSSSAGSVDSTARFGRSHRDPLDDDISVGSELPDAIVH